MRYTFKFIPASAWDHGRGIVLFTVGPEEFLHSEEIFRPTPFSRFSLYFSISKSWAN